ncbi:hypothetical protein V1277_005004 [Bradyrhizobium sp. AZCC 1588]
MPAKRCSLKRYGWRDRLRNLVGWAKRSVPTIAVRKWKWWARRKRAFAHPTGQRRTQH